MDDKKHELIELGAGEIIEFTYNIICNRAEIHIRDKVIRIARGDMLWLCEEFLRQYGEKKEDVYKGKYEQLVFKYADVGFYTTDKKAIEAWNRRVDDGREEKKSD